MDDSKTSNILFIILGVLSAIIFVAACVASAIKAIRDRRRILLQRSRAGQPADSIDEKKKLRGSIYIVHDAERKARIAASMSNRGSQNINGDRIKRKSKSVDSQVMFRHSTTPGSQQRGLVRHVRFQSSDQKRISLLKKYSFETSIDNALHVHGQPTAGMIIEKEQVSSVV